MGRGLSPLRALLLTLSPACPQHTAQGGRDTLAGGHFPRPPRRTWRGTFGEGVVGQSPPAHLILRLHHHHHVEAVAGEILLLRRPAQGARDGGQQSPARGGSGPPPSNNLCKLCYPELPASTRQGLGAAQPRGTALRHSPAPTCTVMAAFFVMVWYIPMKATLLSKS